MDLVGQQSATAQAGGTNAGGRPSIIMLLANTFETDSRVLKEARSAVDAGFDVTILAVEKRGLPNSEMRDGFAVRRLGGFRSIRVLRRIVWYVRCLRHCLLNRAAIIHVNDLDPLPIAWLAARLTGAGLVYDSHELWSHGQASTGWSKSVRLLVCFIERFFAARTDANVQADPGRSEVFARQYGLPAPLTLSNCPTLQDDSPNGILRNTTGLSGSERILVYSGSIGPGRGVQTMIAALEHLPENVHLVLLGFGGTAALHEFMNSSPRGHRVHIVPPVPYDDVIPTLATADLGLCLIQDTNLSYRLGAPNKLFEYMMAGLPVVGSDLPGIASIVRAVDFGLLVDPDDSRAVANAVIRLLADDDLYRRFRDNALRGRRIHCWEKQVQGLLECYRRLASQRGLNKITGEELPAERP
jgi:glycosyltransferase involved in cell wall biosynthesis